MPNFYCEYCGIYLKHSSPFGRKQHSRGKKHIYNKVEFYSQFLIEFQQQHECNVNDKFNVDFREPDACIAKWKQHWGWDATKAGATSSIDGRWASTIEVHAATLGRNGSSSNA